jgi:hypothetical protein
MRFRRQTLALCGLVLTVACRNAEPPAYRGARLQVAALLPEQTAEVVLAAIGGALPTDDPTLRVLIDPIWLPRTEGLAGGDSIPRNVVAAIRSLEVVRGTCRVPLTKKREPLICRADRAGYVARVSQPFQLAPDSLQMYLVVQQYAIPGGPAAERIRFERAYHLVRRGSRWRAVREARLIAPN